MILCIMMHWRQYIGFEKVKKETSDHHNVFYEEKRVCNKGRARYQLNSVRVKKFPVSEDFAATICALPGSYNEKEYFDFLEDWGTVSLSKFWLIRLIIEIDVILTCIIVSVFPFFYVLYCIVLFCFVLFFFPAHCSRSRIGGEKNRTL